MTLPDQLFPVTSCFLAEGRPLTYKELGKAVKKSQATVKRWVAELRADGWLEPQMGGFGGDLLLLNLERPGMDQYLELVYIESGLSGGRYRRNADQERGLVDYLRSAPDPFPPPVPDAIKHLASLATEATVGLEDEHELRPQYARVFRRRFREICFFPLATEGEMQRIYRKLKLERARDFIHLMIHLNEDLCRLPEFNGVHTRKFLLSIALRAEYNARVFRRYTNRVNTAAQVGLERSRTNDTLAEWAQDYFMPATTFARGNIVNEVNGVAVAERKRRADEQIDQQQLVRHGGTPSTADIGHGGDVLLAQRLLDCVADLYCLIEEIRALPEMAEFFQSPEIAGQFSQESRPQYPSDGLALSRAQVDSKEVDTVLPITDDRLEPPHGQAPVREVAGAELRRGDQLLRINDRPVKGDPVVLERSNDTLRLLYDGRFELATSLSAFADGALFAVRREDMRNPNYLK